MKTLISAAFGCAFMLLVPTASYATSAQWDLNPLSGDWNTPANWTPNQVPNGANDIATFGLSNTTNVSISANTEVDSIVFAPAATNPYSITVNPNVTLTLSGSGVVNDSGSGQTFHIAGAQMIFTNSASAGNATIEPDGGSINFSNHSTAGNALILPFAGEDAVNFFDNSTAGSAQIDTTNAVGESVSFHDNSTAGTATIRLGEFTVVSFLDHSSADNAIIIVGPTLGFPNLIQFSDFSTAGNADISGAGVDIIFSGSSKGGTAAIGLFFDFVEEVASTLDISGHNAPGVTIGSLAGDESASVELGVNNLTVGTNNLSTTFAGTIQGMRGSLTKVGTGTLILSGNSTYTGDTKVNRGVLQVDGSTTSNTLVNRQGTLTGTGTIHGTLSNQGTVSPGSPTGTLTVSSFTQANYATLMIQIANTTDFGALNVLGTANLGGQLSVVLLNGFVPGVGDSFTFLTAGAVNGTLLMRNRNIDDLAEHWEISYFPTYALLTVAAGNVSVPDAGSTILLLVLGLVGLLMYRRSAVRPNV